MAAPDAGAIKVFYHVCAMNHWEAVVREQMTALLFSGLYDACERVHCFVAGPSADACKAALERYGGKVAATARPLDTTYERLTLNAMRNEGLVAPNDRVFYMHSKGVTKPGQPNVDDWRFFLMHNLVKEWRTCVRLLDAHDAVGANFRGAPLPHFSGNLWWATGAHILRLPPQATADYIGPEMWICTAPGTTFASGQTTRRNDYAHPNPPRDYVDASSSP